MVTIPKIKCQDGDIFAIPLEDGTYAICYLMCAFKRGTRFSGTIGFGIIAIQDALTSIPSNEKFLTPRAKAWTVSKKIYYTSDSLIKSGDWPIIGSRPILKEQEKYSYIIRASHLYRHPDYVKEPLRFATQEDIKIYPQESLSAMGGVASLILSGDYGLVPDEK